MTISLEEMLNLMASNTDRETRMTRYFRDKQQIPDSLSESDTSITHLPIEFGGDE